MKNVQIPTPPETLRVIPQYFKQNQIMVPRMEYKVVAQPILEAAFTGNVTAIPTVLMFYLSDLELKVISCIIQETMEYGECDLSFKGFSCKLGSAITSIRQCIANLRRMNAIYEHKHGWHTVRVLDYRAIQHLDKLISKEDYGICKRLRRKVRLKSFYTIDRDDLLKSYDNYILPPEHDIEEEEEYD